LAFVVAAFVGGIVGTGKVSAQCGNYVIMLDDQGKPIIDRQAVDHESLAGLWTPSQTNFEPSRPAPPCSGPYCRQANDPQSLPPPPPDRNYETESAVLVSGATFDDREPATPFRRFDRLPSPKNRVLPLRPPEAL